MTKGQYIISRRRKQWKNGFLRLLSRKKRISKKFFLQKIKKVTKKVLTFYIVHSILSKSVAKTTKTYGILAQLGEHLPYKQRVIGSSPIGPTYGNNA